jgi:hypothetical protein
MMILLLLLLLLLVVVEVVVVEVVVVVMGTRIRTVAAVHATIRSTATTQQHEPHSTIFEKKNVSVVSLVFRYSFITSFAGICVGWAIAARVLRYVQLYDRADIE